MVELAAGPCRLVLLNRIIICEESGDMYDGNATHLRGMLLYRLYHITQIGFHCSTCRPWDVAGIYVVVFASWSRTIRD
jgi:hypothetical protein